MKGITSRALAAVVLAGLVALPALAAPSSVSSPAHPATPWSSTLHAWLDATPLGRFWPAIANDTAPSAPADATTPGALPGPDAGTAQAVSGESDATPHLDPNG